MEKILKDYREKSEEITKARKKRVFKRNLFIFLMLVYPVLHFLIFWLYVNINTVILSFSRYSFMQQKWIFVGLDNFRLLFEDFSAINGIVKKSIYNSLIFFPFNNMVLLPISIICAYILFKKITGYKVFRVIFFLPSIISIVVLTMVYGFMLDSTFGPINDLLTYIGLGNIIPANGWLGDRTTAFPMILLYCLWAGIGYNIVLITGAIQRVPKEILESGELDGIGMWRELWSIIIPLIFPTITTLFIIGCTVVFTLFLQPMMLTQGGPNGQTMTIAYNIILFTKGNQLERAATMGLFFSLIGIPVIFGFKYFLEKITPQVDY